MTAPTTPRQIAPTLIACVALALPPLIAYNAPPSATFFNQAAAFVGWGAFLLLLAMTLPPRAWPCSRGMSALLGVLAIWVVANLVAPFWNGLPWALALSTSGTVLAAMLVAVVAAALAEAGLGAAAFRAFCIGLVVAGLSSAAVGMVQVYAPQWADGRWIAHATTAGRAIGNLRQPNHLSSLLLWSIVAVIWLGESRVLQRTAALVLALLLLFVVVLSGSRTGALATLTLAGWGLLDRRLSRQARITLSLAPVAYGLMWVGAAEWAHYSNQVFGGETRFSGSGDISSSRFAIWSNTLQLIKAHPWLGVGPGEFNFAWTLTPFPDRPLEFFDHAHNLPLQFAVELGVPLAGAALGLLLWALIYAARVAIDVGRAPGSNATNEPPPVQRAAFVMVLMVAVHSLLEYPLWYAYFLLPTTFAFGLCLGSAATTSEAVTGKAAFNKHPTRPLVLASMVLVFASLMAVNDYAKVVVIFAPPSRAASLDERIAAGRGSVLFSHHADYAAVTVVAHPSDAMSAFVGAPHYLLDTRLMIAWATALDEVGETDRARYLAARLKEFKNDQAEPFFAVCVAEPASNMKRPFQCEAPIRNYTYLDFR